MNRVFNCNDLFNYVFKYVPFYDQLQFASASIWCNKWVRLSIKANDYDELIFKLNKKIIITTENQLILEISKTKFIDLTQQHLEFIISNQCFVLLDLYMNYLYKIYPAFLINKIMMINCCEMKAERTIYFICKKFNNFDYDLLSLMAIVDTIFDWQLENITPEYQIKLLYVAAKYASINTFEKIFNKLKNNLNITELNTLLMTTCTKRKVFWPKKKFNEIVNNIEIQYAVSGGPMGAQVPDKLFVSDCFKTKKWNVNLKMDKRDITQNYIDIIKLCIDQGANPYIKIIKHGSEVSFFDMFTRQIIGSSDSFDYIKLYILNHSTKYYDYELLNDHVQKLKSGNPIYQQFMKITNPIPVDVSSKSLTEEFMKFFNKKYNTPIGRLS